MSFGSLGEQLHWDFDKLSGLTLHQAEFMKRYYELKRSLESPVSAEDKYRRRKMGLPPIKRQ